MCFLFGSLVQWFMIFDGDKKKLRSTKKTHAKHSLATCDETAKMQTCRDLNIQWETKMNGGEKTTCCGFCLL